MSTDTRRTPAWLPNLTEQVQAALEERHAGRHDRRPALEQELHGLQDQMKGWRLTLGNSTLSPVLREAVEKDFSTALERAQEIEAALNEMKHTAVRAEELIEPARVLDRLTRLSDVLGADDVTRGNLELSLHIDRITCFRDDRVVLRMCKLGIMPDAVELLATHGGPATTATGAAVPSRARRRGKLRVVEDDPEVDLRAQASFIADVDRFAGLSDDWFWIDEFRMPATFSWAAMNAEAVFLRRREARLSFAKLATEFDVTPPTARAAVRAYLAAHPGEQDIALPRGGRRKAKFDLAAIADEARQRWIDGESKESLARRFACSAPTVGKAIAYAYERDGLPMPTRAEARRAKVTEARRLLDEENSLDDIAAAMKCSDTTARQYLRESFAAEGRPMPDLRRRPD